MSSILEWIVKKPTKKQVLRLGYLFSIGELDRTGWLAGWLTWAFSKEVVSFAAENRFVPPDESVQPVAGLLLNRTHLSCLIRHILPLPDPDSIDCICQTV